MCFVSCFKKRHFIETFNGEVKCKVLNGFYYSEQIAPFPAIYIFLRYIERDIFVYLIPCKPKDGSPTRKHRELRDDYSP